VLGIDMTDAAGITPAGRAFLTVRDWLTDARPAGCQDTDGLRRCSFVGADGTGFTVVWAQGGTVTVYASGLEVCRLDGNCAAGASDLPVDAQPVLLREGQA
jgi:hypothetical protein